MKPWYLCAEPCPYPVTPPLECGVATPPLPDNERQKKPLLAIIGALAIGVISEVFRALVTSDRPQNAGVVALAPLDITEAFGTELITSNASIARAVGKVRQHGSKRLHFEPHQL